MFNSQPNNPESAAITRVAQKMFSEFSADFALILDRYGALMHASDGARAILEEGTFPKGKLVFDYLTPASAKELKQVIDAVARKGLSVALAQLELAAPPLQAALYLKTRVFYDDVADQLWLVGTNVTDLKLRELELLNSANKDPLTGLPNRKRLNDYLGNHLAETKHGDGAFAALAIDLDGFKKANDAHGHHAGDQLLIEVADRIKKVVREGDLVSRLGGDEFMLILSNLCTEEEAKSISLRILDALARPYAIGGSQIYVSGSLGVALYPQHGETASELMQNADHALYKSKQMGKNRMSLFTPELKEKSSLQVGLDSSMHEAIMNGEFSLYYQPIVDTTGTLKGAEALMRWIRPDGKMISPADFIPVAETNGLITILGDYALRSAAMQLRRFQEAGLTDVYMSVNVSPRQLRQPDFVKNLKRILTIAEIDPTKLVLELTESVLMHEQQKTQSLLRSIAATGVRLSIDDFGTGYSCLAYLKSYPISNLKIDRSFIIDLEKDIVSRPIVKAIIDLAGALNMNTVVEGVETAGQASLLAELGATYLQGFLFSKPLPVEDFSSKYVGAEKGALNAL